MDGAKWLDTIERFWWDLIGTIVPGAFMVVPIALVIRPVTGAHLVPPANQFEWAALAVLCFAAGHMVSSVGGKYVDAAAARLLSFIPYKSYRMIAEETVASEPFLTCEKESGLSPSGGAVLRLSNVRNVVMTMLKDGDRHTTYRFTFLALFNRGVATALALTSLAVIGLAASYAEISLTQAHWLLLFLGTLPMLFLLERASYFSGVAQRIPFAMRLGAKRAAADEKRTAVTKRIPRTVYLAGGFHSGWQDSVIRSVDGIRWLDPRIHQLTAPSAYSAWDLEAIREADTVFANIEPTNPGLYSLALEIGFARALDKYVILVEPQASSATNRYLSMCRVAADVTVQTVEEGVKLLQELRTLHQDR